MGSFRPATELKLTNDFASKTATRRISSDHCRPGDFTQPWEAALTYKRQPDTPFQEDICMERRTPANRLAKTAVEIPSEQQRSHESTTAHCHGLHPDCVRCTCSRNAADTPQEAANKQLYSTIIATSKRPVLPARWANVQTRREVSRPGLHFNTVCTARWAWYAGRSRWPAENGPPTCCPSWRKAIRLFRSRRGEQAPEPLRGPILRRGGTTNQPIIFHCHPSEKKPGATLARTP